MTVVNFLSSHQNLPYFKNTINTYTGVTAEPAPGRSVANYPNAKYVSAEHNTMAMLRDTGRLSSTRPHKRATQTGVIEATR